MITDSIKLVFVDFDGVLVNHNSWYARDHNKRATGDPPCVAALNHITDTTGALIVVSSTWRIGTPVIELREILTSWGVTGKVIDKTPRLQGKKGPIWVSLERGEEIKAWMEAFHRWPIEAFAILDDDKDMGALTPWLVKTQFEPGLTMEDAEKAIGVLNGVTE